MLHKLAVNVKLRLQDARHTDDPRAYQGILMYLAGVKDAHDVTLYHGRLHTFARIERYCDAVALHASEQVYRINEEMATAFARMY